MVAHHVALDTRISYWLGRTDDEERRGEERRRGPARPPRAMDVAKDRLAGRKQARSARCLTFLSLKNSQRK